MFIYRYISIYVDIYVTISICVYIYIYMTYGYDVKITKDVIASNHFVYQHGQILGYIF